MFTRCIPLLAPTLFLCGCVVETAGPTQHDYRSIDLDQSEYVRVNLKIGAGRLRVGAGTQKLVRADFTYNVPSWKPYVRYDNAGGHGVLTIEQPGTRHSHIGNVQYEWDVRLNREVPVDLHVNCGAGDADLEVGTLMLRSVDVEMGVGKVDLDLRGTPKRSYDVRIRGGVGEAVVHLPADAGIRATAEGGLGEIKVSGLRRQDREYVNDAYDQSKVKIHLDVRGGIGSIRLIAD
jgi:hypothetical protein